MLHSQLFLQPRSLSHRELRTKAQETVTTQKRLQQKLPLFTVHPMVSNYAMQNTKPHKTRQNDKIRQITPKCLRQVIAASELANSQTPAYTATHTAPLRHGPAYLAGAKCVS